MERDKVGKWYVIHTKPRQEERARDHLGNQGYEVYLPLLKRAKRLRGRWKEVIEPLFPRYLFVRLVAYEDDFAPIRSTQGVNKMVRFGDNPAVMRREVIDSLRRGEQLSGGLYLESSKIFEQGAKVEIIEGPLAGIRAIVQCDSGKDRVILLLNMLGRDNATAVPRDVLAPLS